VQRQIAARRSLRLSGRGACCVALDYLDNDNDGGKTGAEEVGPNSRKHQADAAADEQRSLPVASGG
jgi:hypothetical protein